MQVPTSETSIEIRGLTKSFQGVVVLKQLDLSVPKGKIVTLLGPSGCGKTTTLRCIAGLETPDAGTISIDGVVADGLGKHLPPRKRGLGIVFQSFALWPHMSVSENVAFPLRRSRVPRAKIAPKVTAVLGLVGLSHVAERYPGQLSGGQQQRVALARALVAEPGAILYDEPLSNLDAKLREQMRREIGDLHRRLGITAIFVTHDQEEAIDLSDQIHVMRDGAIVQSGDPMDIFDRPRNKYVCEFFGHANIFAVKASEKAGDLLRVVTETGETLLATPGADRSAASTYVAVRPHQMTLAAPGTALSGEPPMNEIAGVVRLIRHQGARSRFQVEANGKLLLEVDAPRPGPPIEIGHNVNVRFHSTDCVSLEA